MIRFVLFLVSIVIVGFLWLLKMNSHPPIVVENYRSYRCHGEDPIEAVEKSFTKQIHQTLIKEFKPSAVEEGAIIISGYAELGIEVTRARYSCSGVEILKKF
jgi:hypothetical protein